MMNLIRYIYSIKKNMTIIMFTTFMMIPTFASLQKGESLVVTEQFKEAIAVLEPLANKNVPRALYLLGCVYLNPQSKHLDYQKGVSLLERAVYMNYGPAVGELAGLYLSGEGVEKNEAKALHYYIQASHIGHGPSQFNCGIMYKEGLGCNKDPEKAYLYLGLASLNKKDLDDLTIDAAKYRDELVPLLTPTQRQNVLRQINLLTLPSNYGAKEKTIP